VPVLTCQVKGHEFTLWRRGVVLGGAMVSETTREYRYCRRCCLHESRQSGQLIETVLPLAVDTEVA
jgi:hypothetical protein